MGKAMYNENESVNFHHLLYDKDRRIIMGKFVVKQSKSGGFVFNLKASNGQVIASGQVYKSIAACRNGIKSIQTNAPVAAVEDQTAEGFEVQKNPKFEIYTDKRGETRFRLKAKNGQVIAVSEGYTSKANCKNGIESVKKNSVNSPVIEPAE